MTFSFKHVCKNSLRQGSIGGTFSEGLINSWRLSYSRSCYFASQNFCEIVDGVKNQKISPSMCNKVNFLTCSVFYVSVKFQQ